MNRNTNMHFSETPQINIKRSSFDESHSIKSTFNVGEIVPLFVDSDILPGDSVTMDVGSLVRMATPIYPIMDNLYMDQYWFFVPHRLVWNHWQEFWGENDDPWTQQTEYEIPQLKAPSGGWTEGTIADYFGLPTKVGNISVNALPFRAYAKIFNDWFRNENTNSNAHIYEDETTRNGNNGSNYITDVELGGKPATAAKFHDYFTSALPSPQKGDTVTIPIGQVAPVSGWINSATTLSGGSVSGQIYSPTDYIAVQTLNDDINTGRKPEIRYRNVLDGQPAPSGRLGIEGTIGRSSVISESGFSGGTFIYPTNIGWNKNDVGLNLSLQNPTAATQTSFNLSADLAQATAATINQLRTAFAIQKYFENAALHGTRYIEYIKGVFGVTSSDARFQRSEYLGGKRIPINIDQIIQTSSTDTTSPQGNTSGFSCTIDRHSAFTKSFEEHGTLMCLGVIRVSHSYQQGIDRMWSRKKWLDFYNPFFAHLGEQPILNKEIYAQGTAKDDEAFGYQEAWAEYRYKQNRVTGYMRSNAQGSLDVWHFADKYTSLPMLSAGWMAEPKENVDRTIAVTSQLMHQFIGDFYFKTKYSRPMPVYSIPGLIDHV